MKDNTNSKNISVAKVAVVLFNLGAPDQPSAIRPFLRNLFLDPAIIRLPFLLRFPLALIISTLRARTAKKIYASLGGGSPLLANTQAQAVALEKHLQKNRSEKIKVFIAMRYWHPMTDETVQDVKKWGANKIILAPLYPQFSSSTTASSIRLWKKQAQAQGLRCETKVLCCYPYATGFIKAISEKIKAILACEKKFVDSKPIRILFSAHNIPQKFVDQGDPYQYQMERTVAAILDRLNLPKANEWVLCYQSRIGRTKWLLPYTKDEIKRAGLEKTPIIIVPIAFVSEHSETLYELDKEYFKIAINSGVPAYLRAQTVGCDSEFIATLAEAISSRIDSEKHIHTASNEQQRICPHKFSNCPVIAHV